MGSDPIFDRAKIATFLVAALMATSSVARADDALEARVARERERDKPGLVLDTVMLSNLHVRVTREHDVDKPADISEPVAISRLEGLTAHTDRTATTVSIGRTDMAIGRTDIVFEGVSSQNRDTPERPAEDLVTRGWRAAVRVGRDVGGIRLEATAALEHAEMQALEFRDRRTPQEQSASLGSGTFYELGVSATKRFKLREHDAWLSLSAGRRVWLGDNPPAGEVKEAFQLMLRFGFTF
jgi:hypothetical protein